MNALDHVSGFEQAFNVLMQVERGYWNDPVGGPTMYGVTERVARAWGYQGDMRQLPLASAKDIAKKEYWDRFQCDQFDAAIGFQIFDAAYNGGHPVQWLQKAVGVQPDGVLGARTIGAARAADPWKVIALFNAQRLRYLAGLGDCIVTYELIAQCIRSGQLSAAQINEHMRDEVFAAWYAKHYPSPPVSNH